MPGSAEQHRSDPVEILDTTELRWFVPGLLPAEIDGWFTGPAGFHQERRDTYLIDSHLDGRCDVGVKRRFGETLELKVRRSLDAGVELGDGLAGPLEVWRRWSPADGLVEVDADARCVEVCKSIVKRRFSTNGSEIEFSLGALGASSGCDVEIAAVTVGSRRWWTFAFAAFGPIATRRDALLAAWQGLVAASPCPSPLTAGAGRAMGYPEWLALT